ncbi:hematopoietic prostaglandin D synthase-like isoform X1 [Oculina patagonica]
MTCHARINISLPGDWGEIHIHAESLLSADCIRHTKRTRNIMSGYKCYYFKVRARAEVCRLSFAAANIEFEDIRLDGDEWAKEKASGRPPFGQMPFIVTPEGKVLGQSGAVMKYICKKAGMYPSDPFDEAVANMITDGVTDLFNGIVKFNFEKDEARKEELKKEFFETTLPARLEKFDALLKGPFFLGDKMTYADIAFFDLNNGFLGQGKPEVPEHLSKFPKLAEHYKRVLDVPGIKAWVEKRPKSDY